MLLAAVPVLAQTEGDTDEAGGASEEEAVSEEITVTARQEEEALQDVPATVSVLTDAQIEAVGGVPRAVDAADVDLSVTDLGGVDHRHARHQLDEVFRPLDVPTAPAAPSASSTPSPTASARPPSCSAPASLCHCPSRTQYVDFSLDGQFTGGAPLNPGLDPLLNPSGSIAPKRGRPGSSWSNPSATRARSPTS